MPLRDRGQRDHFDLGERRSIVTRARGLWVGAAVLAVSCGSAHAMTYPYVVEADADGQNNGFYGETGTWVDSSLHSIADGLTPGIGSRCATTAGSQANFKLNANFTGDGLGASTMDFEVFVTWPAPGRPYVEPDQVHGDQ